MMLPVGWLNAGFIVLTVFCIGFFYLALGRHRGFLLTVLAWAALQGALAWWGFYTLTDAVPPRLFFGVLPTILATVLFGWMAYGKGLRKGLRLRQLHGYHLIRIPVELIFLHGLYEYGFVAKHMTYEGTNFDVFIGITAVLILWLGWSNGKPRKGLLIGWNVLGTVILLSVFVQAVLTAPSPMQQLSFDQPTVAIMHLPFIWLATIVAPLAILGHVLSIRVLRDLPATDVT